MTEKYRNTPKGRIAPNGYRLCDPLPEGQILLDNEKKQWVIGKPIGMGGFGEIYLCYEKSDPMKNYVMKLDNINGPLFVEVNFVLRACSKNSIASFMNKRGLSFLGVPRFISSGTHQSKNGGYRFLIMERLGEELQKVLETRRLSIRVTCRIACRIIDVLEYIHDQGYIHADIKAPNILRSCTNSSKNGNVKKRSQKRGHDDNTEDSDNNIDEDDKYYLIDYGLAERYTLQGVHKPYEFDKRKANNGTSEFRSRDAHIGVISRRSDIESLGFNLIIWFYGRHPWANLLKNPDHVHEKKCWAMKNITDFLKEAFNDIPFVSNGESSDSKTTKASKSQTKSVSKNIPINTIPPKGLNKFFEEINSLAHDERPNYTKFKEILYEIARLNSDESVKLPSSCTKKKSKSSNEEDSLSVSSRKRTTANKQNDLLNDEIDSAPNLKGKRKVKQSTNTNSKRPSRFIKMECDTDETSLNDDTEIEEEPKEKIRPSRIRNGNSKASTNGTKISKSALSTKSPNEKANKRTLAISRSQNRALRNRIKIEEESDSDEVKEEPLPTKKLTRTPRRPPRLSTPLIMMTPPDGGDSPLFGPFEPDDSIKENRDLSTSSCRNNTLSSFISQNSDEDEDTQDRQLRSCRIYINNKRCQPKQTPESKKALPTNGHYKASKVYRKASSSATESSSSTYIADDDSFSKTPNGKMNKRNGTSNLSNKNGKTNPLKSVKQIKNGSNLKSNGYTSSNKTNNATKSTGRSKYKSENKSESSDFCPLTSTPVASNSAPMSTIPIVETAAMQRIRMLIEKKKQSNSSTKK